MQKAFLIDLARCNGCRNCQIACKDEYCDNDWSPYAKPQPEIGQFWMGIEEKTRGQVPVVKVSYFPKMCAHCDDAPCAAVCPDDAFERRDDGLMYIVPDKCSGCMKCIDACPIGVIYGNEEFGIAQKCAGCAHLLDDGWTEPRCVDACPTSALRFVDIDEVGDAVPPAELSRFGSHAYYLNIPKRFAAGCAVDRTIDEVLIGADVKLIAADGSIAMTAKTDEFGDYRFEPIEPAVYTVEVKAEGYAPFTVEADVMEEDRYLGDHFLTKE